MIRRLHSAHTKATGPILMVVSVDWFVVTHRLGIIRRLVEGGADVVVMAEATGEHAPITEAGATFIALPIQRHGVSVVADARLLWFLRKTMRELSPRAVMNVSTKPVIYGSVAARLAGVSTVVNAISGLGYAYSDTRRARPIGRLVSFLYRVALRRTDVIFQNRATLTHFVSSGKLDASRAHLIRGVGADVAAFSKALSPKTQPPAEDAATILFLGRLLWTKGLDTLRDAHVMWSETDPTIRTQVAGRFDPGHPEALTQADVDHLEHLGIEYLGNRHDTIELLARATIVVLPTRYPEGVPKVLLEAGAAGKAVVATTVPGISEVIDDGVDGVLVPPQDAFALSEAVVALLNDPDRRRILGDNLRRKIHKDFDERSAIDATVALLTGS